MLFFTLTTDYYGGDCGKHLLDYATYKNRQYFGAEYVFITSVITYSLA